MNTTRPAAPVQQTPEQLLQALEAQLSLRRTRREKSPTARTAALAVGILFIIVAAGAALLMLEHLLGEMRPANAANDVAPPASPRLAE